MLNFELIKFCATESDGKDATEAPIKV